MSATTGWSGRRRMPDLVGLDHLAPGVVTAFVERLRESVDGWAERYVRLVREHVPEFDALSDREIGESARSMLRDELVELAALRIPDEVLLVRLERMARERVARGISPEALTLSYRIASRELLTLMDTVATDVDLPSEVLLSVHDSTWEFAGDAAAVFARVHRDHSVAQARVDAERRAGFARGVLSGESGPEQIHREAPLFGLDPQAGYVPLAVRSVSPDAVHTLRRDITRAVRSPSEALMFTDMGPYLGAIAPTAPDDLAGHLIAAGPVTPLEQIASGFGDAVLALETAERFGLAGLVRLTDLGPRPLVFSAPGVAAALEQRHLAPLTRTGRSGDEIAQTVRAFLDCDQDAAATARRLTVHPNTVRYRVRRFREITGLDVRITTDLVTTWWLLNRRDAR